MSAKGRPERELLPLGGKARSAKGAPVKALGDWLMAIVQHMITSLRYAGRRCRRGTGNRRGAAPGQPEGIEFGPCIERDSTGWNSWAGRIRIRTYIIRSSAATFVAPPACRFGHPAAGPALPFRRFFRPPCASPRSNSPASSPSSIPRPSASPASWSAWSAQRLRQVQRDRRRALGAGRIVGPALRGERMQDVIFNGSGERKPVGRASRRAGVRQQPGPRRRAVGAVRRDLRSSACSRATANRLLHQQPARAPPRHRRHLPRHRPGPARLRDHRAGHDLAHHRGEARGAARVPRRGRGRLQVQGAAQGDRRAHRRHAREPRARRGHPAGTGQPARASSRRRRRSPPSSATSRRGCSQAQQLLWFSKQQDAARAPRALHAPRSRRSPSRSRGCRRTCAPSESRLETLRSDHYAAGDALHERQGEFYAANAEVTRLEQQLAFARESETRLSQQLAQLTEQLAALGGEEAALAARPRGRPKPRVEARIGGARARRPEAERARDAALPALEEAVRARRRAARELQEQIAAIEQAIRVAETQRDNGRAQSLAELARAAARLEDRARGLAPPVDRHRARVEEQLADESRGARGEGGRSARAARQRAGAAGARSATASEAAQQASRRHGELEARAQALAALQAQDRAGQGQHRLARARTGSRAARLLWQATRHRAGLGGRARSGAARAAQRGRARAARQAEAWLARRDAAAGPDGGLRAGGRRCADARPRRRRRAAREGALAAPGDRAARSPTGCAGVRCHADAAAAVRDRARARRRRGLRDAAGPPRQRAGDRLLRAGQRTARRARAPAGARRARRTRSPAPPSAAAAARAALAARRGRARRDAAGAITRESLAFASQQRRCHDLELELMQLRQAAAAAERRRAQIAQELADLGGAGGRRAGARTRGGGGARRRAVAAARRARAARGGAPRAQRGRGRARARPRARARRRARGAGGRIRRAQLPRARWPSSSAGARRSSCRSRSSRSCSRKLTSERAAVDWTPVEEALQRQLAARGVAEQALAAARDRLEGLTAELRAAEEAQLVGDASARPGAREDRGSAAEGAGGARCPSSSSSSSSRKRRPTSRSLPGAAEGVRQQVRRCRRDRRACRRRSPSWARSISPRWTSSAIAQERKDYLDAQAADLTEAMTTLESAIRQIDREIARAAAADVRHGQRRISRALFPTLFGGGQAQARADRRGDPRLRRAGRSRSRRASATPRSTCCRAARRR